MQLKYLARFTGAVLLAGSLLSSLYNTAAAQTDEKPFFAVCYSPFREGQSPSLGIFPTEEEVKDDLVRVSCITSAIRTFGVDGVLYSVPSLCDERGLGVYVGAWISPNEATNNSQIQNLIALANEGHPSIKGLVVGGEVLLRNDVTEETLIAYINQVRSATGKPVTTNDTWNEYMHHPNVANAVDYLLINIYPYWEGRPIEGAAQYVVDAWNQVMQAYPDKEVIIGETGWPSGGDYIGSAEPSEENQRTFLEEFMPLAGTNNIKYMYFEFADESWKSANEGSVGAHWGLYYERRMPKPVLYGLISKGDVNGDCNTDILDVQHTINQALLLDKQTELADINEDGIVDILDVQRDINIALGL